MRKPKITIYFWDNRSTFNCDFANAIYGERLRNIAHIFEVLKIYYLCQKDKDGNYMQLDISKPTFDSK
jgi:hypothetical protein